MVPSHHFSVHLRDPYTQQHLHLLWRTSSCRAGLHIWQQRLSLAAAHQGTCLHQQQEATSSGPLQHSSSPSCLLMHNSIGSCSSSKRAAQLMERRQHSAHAAMAAAVAADSQNAQQPMSQHFHNPHGHALRAVHLDAPVCALCV